MWAEKLFNIIVISSGTEDTLFKSTLSTLMKSKQTERDLVDSIGLV